MMIKVITEIQLILHRLTNTSTLKIWRSLVKLSSWCLKCSIDSLSWVVYKILLLESPCVTQHRAKSCKSLSLKILLSMGRSLKKLNRFHKKMGIVSKSFTRIRSSKSKFIAIQCSQNSSTRGSIHSLILSIITKI